MRPATQLRVLHGRAALPVVGGPQVTYVLVYVEFADTEGPRTSVDHALLLDRSGSMARAIRTRQDDDRDEPDHKIDLLKQAVARALPVYAADDHVAIVSFASSAEIVARRQRASNQGTLQAAVRRLDADGGTNIAAGLRTALNQVLSAETRDTRRQIILLTDGQDTDTAACLSAARAAAEAGVSVRCFGLGADWNETLLNKIAAITGGSVEFIEAPERLADVFKENVLRARASTIESAALELTALEAEVHDATQVLPTLRVLDPAHIGEASGLSFGLGTVDAVAGGAVLFKIAVPNLAAGTHRLGQLALIDGSRTVRRAVCVADIDVTLAASEQVSADLEPRVKTVAEKVSAYKLQLRGLEEIRAGQIETGTTKLRTSATRLLNLGEQKLANKILQDADRIRHTRRLDETTASKTVTFGEGSRTVRLSDITQD